MIRARVDGAEITILPVVKGLVADGDAVARAVRELRPEAVGISVSREDLAALRDKSVYGDYEMGTLETAYAENLASFGEVELPTPAFVAAIDACQELNIPVVPLDMNDADFTEAYVAHIKAGDLVRESLFARGVKRRRFDLSSPQAFARDWDRKVNRSKGFRELERRREEHMANALRNLTRRYRSILAIIETERADGVGAELGASGA